ncbi:MAG TPA: hypothetical protein VMS49_02210 [Lysobacter sp.]|jgi:hypothetical protein|nr:hypothetical protein [Lysobacter sp.]
MSDSPLQWDPFQRDVLDALGHVVYHRRDASPSSAAPAATPDPADAAAPPLLRAIARAANAPLASLADLPALDRLRAPAAKRALWPRLRALRKASRG